MNDVKTFARAGEAAGTAVGIGVKTARKGAVRAGRQLAERAPDRKDLKRAVRKARKARKAARKSAKATMAYRWRDAQDVLSDRAADVQERFADRWGDAQDVLSGRVLEARRELASRLDPKPRSRRRWPWLLLLAALGGAVAVAVLSRRPQSIEEPAPAGPGSASQAGRTTWPDGNGVVGARRRSRSTD
ncbi:MAG: hypothetical protein ACRDRZ_16265 [Pseudonocardiaceae bacterium]